MLLHPALSVRHLSRRRRVAEHRHDVAVTVRLCLVCRRAPAPVARRVYQRRGDGDAAGGGTGVERRAAVGAVADVLTPGGTWSPKKFGRMPK